MLRFDLQKCALFHGTVSQVLTISNQGAIARRTGPSEALGTLCNLVHE